MTRKHLVVSAVNLVEAGTLEVLVNTLEAADKLADWKVTAIVHDQARFNLPGVRFIERKGVKASWFRRIKFEYLDCIKLAKVLKPDFWLSMHDMSPTLGKTDPPITQAVYCHNAMCFYKLSLKEFFLEPKLFLFSTLYGLFYRINLRKNRTVVVQQEWLRNAFREQFGFQGEIIVATPQGQRHQNKGRFEQSNRFFYPAFPRAFKNFECLLQAWEVLCLDETWDGELTISIDEKQNRYARSMHKKYKHLRNVTFAGRMTKQEVENTYSNVDCLVFPSKLETFGLPIAEAKAHGLYVLVSDLPYAKESVANYEAATFFDPNSATDLAEKLRAFRENKLTIEERHFENPALPFVEDWDSLIRLLLRNKSKETIDA